MLCSYPGLHFMFALRAVVMAYDSNAYDIMVNNGNRSTKSDLTFQTSLRSVRDTRTRVCKFLHLR